MSDFIMVPCGGCERHVRSNEPSCPFCGVAVDADRPVPGRPGVRLGRAATFAFGAALAASTAVGCSESHDGRDAGPGTDAASATDAGVDSGGVAPPYGTPPDDGGFAPMYGAPPEDAGFAPLYGGAPPD